MPTILNSERPLLKYWIENVYSPIKLVESTHTKLTANHLEYTYVPESVYQEFMHYQNSANRIDVGKLYQYNWPDGRSVAQFLVTVVDGNFIHVLFTNGARNFFSISSEIHRGMFEIPAPTNETEPIFREAWKVVQGHPDAEQNQYFITMKGKEEQQVTRLEYVYAARNAGFVSKSGNDTDIPAASFSNGKTSGRVVYSN